MSDFWELVGVLIGLMLHGLFFGLGVALALTVLI